MYELKDSYLTGVKTIDDQHRQIFKLADDAYQLLKDENKLFKDDDLLKIVKGLQEYTQYHFTEEETYMEAIGYEGLDTQKRHHNQFIKEIDVIGQEIDSISLGNQNELIEMLLEKLTTWFQEHIEALDSKIT